MNYDYSGEDGAEGLTERAMAQTPSETRERYRDHARAAGATDSLEGQVGTRGRRNWSTHRQTSAAGVIVRGLLAGVAGVAAMTLAEKLEQAWTKRPNSYVPAHTLERLLGLPTRPDAERLWLNWVMHWGQGIALGPVRALMAEKG